MPSPEQHQRQAEHNRAFALSFDLASTVYRDSAVTAISYSALHLIEWFLTSHGHTSRRDHQARDSYLARFAELRAIYADYNELRFQSEAARYECASFTAQTVRDDLLPRLSKIEAHIRSLTSSQR
ncbi:MAG: hypothetical protein KGJ80_06300 [Chloroflexota bacterium]|nr:hypothetical protein [Chloroflexota bacterium]